MESSIRKDKKKKKRFNNESSSSNMVRLCNVDPHCEARIADLKESNKILSQSLENSYKIISLQNKTIEDLQSKQLQLPKMLKTKLHIIGKTVKDLQEHWNDVFNIVSDEASMTNLWADASEQRPNSEITPLPLCNGSVEMVSIGIQSHLGKKNKKKKDKNCVSSTCPSPLPSTSRESNDVATEVTDATVEGQNKSSTSKERSKSKKRKVEEILEQSNAGGVSDGRETCVWNSVHNNQVKKSKKSSKSKKKIAKLSLIRMKPLKKTKKKSQKKNSKISWTVDSLRTDIKVEPQDEPPANPSLSLKLRNSGPAVYSSSSDSSDTSLTDVEPNIVTSNETFPLGMSPEVLLKDFMKNPEEGEDPLISRCREKVLNKVAAPEEENDGTFMHQGVVMNKVEAQKVVQEEEQVIPLKETEPNTVKCDVVDKDNNDNDQSAGPSNNSSEKENLVIVDDFVIGDNESGLSKNFELCNLVEMLKSLANHTQAAETECDKAMVIGEL